MPAFNLDTTDKSFNGWYTINDNNNITSINNTIDTFFCKYINGLLSATNNEPAALKIDRFGRKKVWYYENGKVCDVYMVQYNKNYLLELIYVKGSYLKTFDEFKYYVDENDMYAIEIENNNIITNIKSLKINLKVNTVLSLPFLDKYQMDNMFKYGIFSFETYIGNKNKEESYWPTLKFVD